MNKFKGFTAAMYCDALVNSVMKNNHAFAAPQDILDEEDNPTGGRFALLYVPYGKDTMIFHCIKEDDAIKIFPQTGKGIVWTFHRSQNAWSVHPPVEDTNLRILSSTMHQYVLMPVRRYLG